MPLLQQAKKVRVFTVLDDKPIDKSQSVAKLASHLARHGVEIVAEDVKSNGRAIGDVFEAYVREHKIDLLVMGAYGHSRIREFILGGATKSVLSPNVGAPFSLDGRLDMKLRGRWWRVPNSHSKRSTTIVMIASSAEMQTNSRLHGNVRAS